MGFMNETPASLDDLALFAAVAQCGSLSGASRETGTPLPTLSRRMTRLERQMGRGLFRRGPSGYALTAVGRALADELAGLADTRRRVERWAQSGHGPVPVRITAGFWTSGAIARGLAPDPARLWQPHFVAATAALDLARREADIGIRNAPPDHPWLARRLLAPVDFAFYGQPDARGYVATPPDTRSQRWLHKVHGDEIVAIASDPRLCLDLAMSGHGHVLLPVFAGDEIAGITRQSDPIPELRHEAWLVAHQDARHDPPIRAAIDEIATLFSHRA